MPVPNDALKDRLSRYREITLGVTGRRCRTDHLTAGVVGFGGWSGVPPTGPGLGHAVKQVSSVVEKFRTKYGASDVKKYDSKFDVAVVAQMR